MSDSTSTEKKFEPIFDRVGLGGESPKNSPLSTFGWLLLFASLGGIVYFLIMFDTLVYSPGEGAVVNLDRVASKISWLIVFTGLFIAAVLILLITRLESVFAGKNSAPSNPTPAEKLP